MKSDIKNVCKGIKNLNKKSRICLIVITTVILICIIPLIWYKCATSPVGKSDKKIIVTIKLGSGTDTIANALKNAGVIKDGTAFKIYCKLNKISGLQAGKYNLSENMELNDIVKTLKTGKVFNENEFNVTFLEGKTMRWIAKKISEVTNNTEDDVFNLLKDTSYIDEIISKYWFLTEEIKDENIYYPLEGYLFPDTYTLANKDISVKDVFKIMLDRMDEVLSEYKGVINASKYSVHEILSMASIVEMEGISDNDRAEIAGVFYNRLNSNMSLGSDVTTYYAAKIDVGERDLYSKELNTYNPYNTRGPKMNGKLPIGPISSVGKASIEAAIYPTSTDYLFFVADKNGKIYFTKTTAEHAKVIADLKANGMWLEFK